MRAEMGTSSSPGALGRIWRKVAHGFGILAAFALLGCAPQSSVPSPTSVAQAGPSPSPAPRNGQPPEVDGITCDRAESVLFHIHSHLAIYVNGEPQQIPMGIGIGQPLHIVPTGDFVDGGSCFSWLHTHTKDGIIHIESPVPRRFTLGEFFAIWGQPLSATQVLNAQGPVVAYVDGNLYSDDPETIPLADHELIQLNVDTDTPPPQPFTWPPGF